MLAHENAHRGMKMGLVLGGVKNGVEMAWKNSRFFSLFYKQKQGRFLPPSPPTAQPVRRSLDRSIDRLLDRVAAPPLERLAVPVPIHELGENYAVVEARRCVIYPNPSPSPPLSPLPPPSRLRHLPPPTGFLLSQC